jgi:hypothetical protein
MSGINDHSNFNDKKLDATAQIEISADGKFATKIVKYDGHTYQVKSSIKNKEEAQRKIDQTIDKLMYLAIDLKIGQAGSKYISVGSDSSKNILLTKLVNNRTVTKEYTQQKLDKRLEKLKSSEDSPKRENDIALKGKLEGSLSSLKKTKEISEISPVFEPIAKKTNWIPGDRPSLYIKPRAPEETRPLSATAPMRLEGSKKNLPPTKDSNPAETQESFAPNGEEDAVNAAPVKATEVQNPESKVVLNFLMPVLELFIKEKTHLKKMQLELDGLVTMQESSKLSNKERLFLDNSIKTFEEILKLGKVFDKQLDAVSEELIGKALTDESVETDEAKLALEKRGLMDFEKTTESLNKVLTGDEFLKYFHKMCSISDPSFVVPMGKLVESTQITKKLKRKFEPQSTFQRIMRYELTLKEVEKATASIPAAHPEVEKTIKFLKNLTTTVNGQMGIPDTFRTVSDTLKKIESFLQPNFVSRLKGVKSGPISALVIYEQNEALMKANYFLEQMKERVEDREKYEKLKKVSDELTSKLDVYVKLTGFESSSQFFTRKTKELSELVNELNRGTNERSEKLASATKSLVNLQKILQESLYILKPQKDLLEKLSMDISVLKKSEQKKKPLPALPQTGS